MAPHFLALILLIKRLRFSTSNSLTYSTCRRCSRLGYLVGDELAWWKFIAWMLWVVTVVLRVQSFWHLRLRVLRISWVKDGFLLILRFFCLQFLG